ncbi:MAG: hypothetical protein V2J10_03755 [Wenzhouxiangella sp.]|jgi:hypothetical protein|nr:hypothetical protein [Wenzhouxiangella sp.]
MTERDPLNLRALPARPVPDDLWTSIDERLHSRRRRPAPIRAMAAAVLVALAVGLWWSADPGRGSGPESLERYRSASVQLENRVARFQQGVIDFDTLMRAGQVEQRLAAVDRRLLKAPMDIALWRQRLALLDELAGLYAGRSALARVMAARENHET